MKQSNQNSFTIWVTKDRDTTSYCIFEIEPTWDNDKGKWYIINNGGQRLYGYIIYGWQYLAPSLNLNEGEKAEIEIKPKRIIEKNYQSYKTFPQ